MDTLSAILIFLCGITPIEPNSKEIFIQQEYCNGTVVMFEFDRNQVRFYPETKSFIEWRDDTLYTYCRSDGDLLKETTIYETK